MSTEFVTRVVGEWKAFHAHFLWYLEDRPFKRCPECNYMWMGRIEFRDDARRNPANIPMCDDCYLSTEFVVDDLNPDQMELPFQG